MSVIPGSVRVTGIIAPSDSADTYAVHDEVYGRGGWRTVTDITARNAITADRRCIGMAVRVLDADGGGTPGFYTLSGGITNSNWAVDEFGGGEGWSGAYSTSYTATAVDLVDGETFLLEEAVAYTTGGIGYLLTVTPSVATGQIAIEIYDDAAKQRLVGTHIVDLEAPTLRSSFSFGYESETEGVLYCTLYCSGVPVSQTASFVLDSVITSPTGSPSFVVAPYGDGIEDDGIGQPRVALASTGGLGFESGKLVVVPDPYSPVYAVGTATGLSVSGAIDDSTSESISAKKVFDSVGCIPLGSSGAPTSGTYFTGSEVLDSANVKWRCTAAGTPGTWISVDNVLEDPDVLYSTSVAVGGTYLFQVPVTGNHGVLFWLRAWAKLAAGTTDSEIPFRIRVYETSDAYGRDVVWQGMGIARQTALTVQLPESQTYMEVSTNDLIETDEGLYIYESNSRYEFARCSGRTDGDITISESLVDAAHWDIGCLVLPVSEWSMVPWVNTDGNPTNKNLIFIEVRHDGLVGDPDLVFYTQVKSYSIAGVPEALV